MQLGGFYIWTIAYQLVRISSLKLKALEAAETISKEPNKDLDSNAESHLLKGEEDQENVTITVASTKYIEDPEEQAVSFLRINIILKAC